MLRWRLDIRRAWKWSKTKLFGSSLKKALCLIQENNRSSCIFGALCLRVDEQASHSPTAPWGLPQQQSIDTTMGMNGSLGVRKHKGWGIVAMATRSSTQRSLDYTPRKTKTDNPFIRLKETFIGRFLLWICFVLRSGFGQDRVVYSQVFYKPSFNLIMKLLVLSCSCVPSRNQNWEISCDSLVDCCKGTFCKAGG